ncbi:hypothetical protein CC77DRAFT_248426 [Alternaria alternata]|uniref:Uncharacterized protein n=1 Tax=Alternaria alternata TaxID=5599 RepID=A0A177DG16_ALTAL|nr:hypothetical protein CC77DRAFT_248426 [Alternaria alternata]OAG18022.1 hypothetical protein CC77DRAFT_248426 [Alternaria alternata]
MGFPPTTTASFLCRTSCIAYFLTLDWLHCLCGSAVLAAARLSEHYSNVSNLLDACRYDSVYSVLTASLSTLLFLFLTFGRLHRMRGASLYFGSSGSLWRTFLYKWCYLWSRTAGEQ